MKTLKNRTIATAMLAMAFAASTMFCTTASAAQPITADDTPIEMAELMPDDGGGFHQVLKTKFIEGNASFMSRLRR